jgi:hypothetical protein
MQVLMASRQHLKQDSGVRNDPGNVPAGTKSTGKSVLLFGQKFAFCEEERKRIL